MNLEAISAIKKSANTCKIIKNQILNSPFSAIKELSPQIFTDNLSYQFSINGNLMFQNHRDLTLTQNDLISIKINSRQESFEAELAFSIYFGNENTLHRLIDTNKRAVIETCQNLCPGLSDHDIIEVLKLSKEEFLQNDDCITIKNLNKHNKLMAGDILILGASLKTQGEKSSTATRTETILITANGAQILTS